MRQVVAVLIAISSITASAQITYPPARGGSISTVAQTVTTPTGNVDGTNATYTLPGAVSGYTIYLNGLLIPPSGYTVSGSSFTLPFAPSVGDVITAIAIATS